MFIVEIAYGMENYQVKKEKFDNQVDAMKYYNEEIKKSIVGAKVYEEIASYSCFGNR